MQKRFIQILVALAMVLVLILGPVAPGALARRADRRLAPARALAMASVDGWDWGGSDGT